MKHTPDQNKTLVLQAFDTLFNKRDYEAAARFWSDAYIQHSAHIEPGREGLFNLVRSLPAGSRWEHGIVMAEGDSVMIHSRYSNADGSAIVVVDIMRMRDGVFVEHWDVIQDEATAEQSKSGRPMFGSEFPA